jgi:hypothetical protein
MVDTATSRMNAGIADLMRQYPQDNTPAYGDVPSGYMIARNADGKVVVVPANKYTPSTGARPDQKLTVGPNGEVVSSPYTSPALDKALDVAQGSASPALSFGETGMADPSGSSFFTPQYTDADFARSLALQNPLNRATTQEDIDEEARLRANLALSAREMQLQPQGNFFGGDQLLTKDRIAQMYGEPSANIPATAKSILQQRSVPTSAASTAAQPAASLPSMAMPDGGVDAAPTNLGMGSDRFGIPGVSVVPGSRFDAASMPAQLSNANYMRFSTDATPQPSAATSDRQTQAPRPPINAGNPIDLTTRSNAPASSAPVPASEQGNRSLLNSIIDKLSSGSSSQPQSKSDLWAAANADPENKAAYFRAAQADTAPSDGNYKRGGTAGGGGQKAAGPHKDAALHKALDIIHTMLTRGH